MGAPSAERNGSAGSRPGLPTRIARAALRPRVSPQLRLLLMIVALTALFLVFAVGGWLTAEEVQAWVEPYGVLAPVVYVLVSTILHCLLVPGPLLSGAAGLLFGLWLGTALALVAAVASAVVAAALARHGGREGLDQLGGPRLEAAGEWLERNGLMAVIVARLAPGIPDAPISYAAGLTRVRTGDLVLGTAIGAAPRAFAYAALGGSLSDLDSPLAYAAVGIVVLTGVVGAVAVRHQVRTSRRAAAALEDLERAPA